MNDKLTFYQQNGFLVLPKLMVDHLAYLRQVDSIITDSLKMPMRITNGLQDLVPELRAMMGYTPLYEIMQQALAGEPLGVDVQFSFGDPTIKGFTPHQDGYFTKSPYGSYASAWTAVDDAHPENGGLYVYSGSHHYPISTHVDSNLELDERQSRTARALKLVFDERKYEKIALSLQAGDTLIIHGNVIHGSFDNNSNRFRRSILFTYAKRGAYVRNGEYVKRNPFKVA